MMLFNIRNKSYEYHYFELDLYYYIFLAGRRFVSRRFERVSQELHLLFKQFVSIGKLPSR